MRGTLKPSEFRKEGRVKMEIPEEREIGEREQNNQNGEAANYWSQGQERKANRWLNHLHEKPLLELMNEQIQLSEFTPVKPTELNCYERLKTLLSVQGAKATEQQANANAKLLKNVVIFETEINKLEQSYQSLERSKKSGQESKKSVVDPKNRSYLCSKSTTKHNSIFDKNSLSYTLNSTLKDALRDKDALREREKRNTQSRYQAKHEHPKHDLIKKSIKEEVTDLKKQSFSRFITHKKELNERTFLDLEQIFTSELERRIEEMVDRKILEYDHLKEENSHFHTVLLEKELHIEGLMREMKVKEERLAYEIEKQEPHQQMITLRLTVQQFYDEYHNLFGPTSLPELKRKLEYMEGMCLRQYSQHEAQHLELYSKLKAENAELQGELRERERRQVEREEELNAVIRQREKYDQLDNSSEKHEVFNRLPEFRQKMEELERLQRFILNRYVEWLNSKSQPEATLIKLVGTPPALHNYEQMVEDMLFFNQQLAPDKQTNYISKLLSAILKLKKVVSPNKLHEKLEPFKSLQEAEIYIKALRSRRGVVKKKTLKQRTEVVIQSLEEGGLLE